MSVPIKSGRETTEHSRALRAELMGAVVLGIGVALALKGHDVEGLGLAAIGATLVAWVCAAYSNARGNVKAAAVRRPADQAPRVI